MSQWITQLSEWGCDTEGALSRTLGDEAFYAECLTELSEDACFEKLRCALEQKKTTAAFDAAHTLKGLFANLGLTPMFDCVVTMVEPLRNGQVEHLEPAYARLMQLNGHLMEILGQSNAMRR